MHAYYDQNELRLRHFFDKVFQLQRRFVTNKLAIVEPDSGRIIDDKWSDPYCWAGHDVLLNCRKYRNRFVTQHNYIKQTGERHYFAPRSDWKPPGWLVALEATIKHSVTEEIIPLERQ